MSSTISLIGESRTATGKGSARELRRNGKIPAVIYGKGKETVKISLPERELTKYYRKAGYATLLMDIDIGEKKYLVIPRNVELHPVTDMIEHADFMFISKDSKVKVSVHIHFINEDKCIGIKRGGVFNIVKREIDLLCPPKDIPSRIDFDVINLDIGQTIHVQDLTLPKGVTAIGEEQNFTIATIVGRGGKAEATEESSEEKATETKK